MRAFAHNFGTSMSCDDDHFLCLNKEKSVGLMTIKEATALLSVLAVKKGYKAIFLAGLENWLKDKDFYYDHDKVFRVLGTVIQLLNRHAITISVPKKSCPLFVLLNDVVFVVAATQKNSKDIKSLQQAYIV